MIIRSASDAIEFNTSSVEKKNHPLPYLYMVEDELICICINAGWMAAFSRNSDRLSFEFLSQSFDPTLMPIGLEIQFFGLEKSERPQKARSLCKANIFLRSCQIPSMLRL